MRPGVSRRTRWRISLGLAAAAWLALLPAPSAEPVTLIRANGPSANRVDILVLGDGYTAAELDAGLYAAHVDQFLDGMFAEEPYSAYRNYFNVSRIDVTSAESGADHPSTGIFRNTALDATYDCAGIQRLICVSTSKVNAVIAASGVPANARDVVIVLVNDPAYGGSGGSIAVASIHPSVVELVLHEVGHSFGLLTDEYGGPPPPSCVASEPSAVNATRVTERESIKWRWWIDSGTPVPTPGTTNGVPGLFEGAAYCDSGAYRPTFNSKMRSLGQPFHQINTEQHIKRIYNLVSPIDDSSPAGSVISTGPSQVFTVTATQPYTHDLDIEWRLDGALQATGPVFSVTGLTAGTHTVTATVRDLTPMVRYDPSGLLTAVRTWTLDTAVPLAIVQHPIDWTVVAGSDVTFSAAATGAPSWRWQVSIDGGLGWSDLTNGGVYGGVTTPTLTVTGVPSGVSGSRYRAVATDASGSLATSSALLTVYPANVELLSNGDFTGGMAGWLLWEVPDIVSSVSAGVFRFHRRSPPLTASGQATVFRHTGIGVGPAVALAASFDLGNTSTVRKRISVLILDGDFSDLAVCTFWLAPGAPLRTYRMRAHPTQAWSDAALYFYAATPGFDGGDYLLDNVSLMADAAGSLTETACVDPTAPSPPGGAVGPELVTNGSFADGLSGWGLWGQIVSQVAGGVFEFYRPTPPDPAGVILQATGAAAAAGEILTATFELGNSSWVRKRVTAILHDGDWSDLAACTFWLAPGQALAPHAMRTFTTKAWTNATVSVYAATVGFEPWIRLDNVSLRRTPGLAPGGTRCLEPGSAPAPLPAALAPAPRHAPSRRLATTVQKSTR